MSGQIHTDWEQIGIANDFLFGKIMRNPRLCKKLLERILPELEIDRIEYPELQKTIREDVDARSVRLDVYVRDGKGVVYNIEMQAVNTRELPKRSRYYQSMIDLQLMDKNQSYKELSRSYIIFICLTDIFGYGHHIYTFENLCKEEDGLPLGDGTKKIFLNASGEKQDVSPQLKAFLDYVAGRSSEDEFVKELEEAVKEAKKNREWRHEYMTLLMRDQENREIGREEGRAEGREEGRQALVSTLREMNAPEAVILQKLMEKFKLTEKEAAKYLT
mgnify:CR=1 FL=1